MTLVKLILGIITWVFSLQDFKQQKCLVRIYIYFCLPCTTPTKFFVSFVSMLLCLLVCSAVSLLSCLQVCSINLVTQRRIWVANGAEAPGECSHNFFSEARF